MAQRNLRTTVLGLIAVLGLCLPGSAMAERHEYRWKIATLAPRNVGWAQQVDALVFPWIYKATDNNLKLKIYWGGVMGNDPEYLQKMRIGQLQGAGISEAGCNLACPEIAVLELPFLLRSYDEVDYLRQMMFSTFDYYFAQHGYKVLMWIDQDFDQLYSTRYPMSTLEDFRRCKFQNWAGQLEAATIKSLGAQPIVTTVIEGHADFKSGLIDTALAPAVYYAGSQLFAVMKYVNPVKLRYAPAMIVINKRDWDQLPEEYQDNLEAGRDAIQAAFVKGTRDENQRALEGMIKYGVKRTEFNAETKAAVMKMTRPVWDQLAGQLYPKQLLEEVIRYLDGFRSGKAVRKPRFKVTVKAGAPPGLPAKPSQKMEAKPSSPEQAVKAAKAAKTGEAEGTQKMSSWERRKAQVRLVQEKLAGLGYYNAAIDGIFGPKTQEAVMSYQSDKGLYESGAIDRRLLRSLGITE